MNRTLNAVPYPKRRLKAGRLVIPSPLTEPTNLAAPLSPPGGRCRPTRSEQPLTTLAAKRSGWPNEFEIFFRL